MRIELLLVPTDVDVAWCDAVQDRIEKLPLNDIEEVWVQNLYQDFGSCQEHKNRDCSVGSIHCEWCRKDVAELEEVRGKIQAAFDGLCYALGIRGPHYVPRPERSGWNTYEYGNLTIMSAIDGSDAGREIEILRAYYPIFGATIKEVIQNAYPYSVVEMLAKLADDA